MRSVALAAAAVLFFAASPILAQSPAPPQPGPGPDFNVAIKPILNGRCTGCHGATVQRAGLRLDDRDAALKGGASGPVIIPGNAEGSKLFQMVATKKMPLDDELSVLELGNLKAWINAGAKWPERRNIQAFTPDPRVDAFRVAMRNLDRTAIDRAVSDPTLIKARGKDGSTLLHHAAVFGDAKLVAALIDKGADVNAVNLDGATPLIPGVRDEAITRVLIDRGADVNLVTEQGVTPLIAAAGRTGGGPVARLLLAKGAKPTPAQLPPLSLSAGIMADLDLTRALAPAVIGPAGLPATILAGNVATARCYACLDYLIAQGVKGPALKDALVAAANSGDAALVKRLLDLGATTDGRGPQDATALIAAAMSDIEPAEKVRLLLAAGADVAVPDAHGRTALTYARMVHPDIVPALVAKGAK
jgi:ankyrin repeat protein